MKKDATGILSKYEPKEKVPWFRLYHSKEAAFANCKQYEAVLLVPSDAYLVTEKGYAKKLMRNLGYKEVSK